MSTTRCCPNLLTFDSELSGNGERWVTWDGFDGDALTVDDTGLDNVDLTNASDALGLQLQVGADQGISAIVRLYSDDGNSGTADRFSSVMLDVEPGDGTVPFLAEFIPFSSFTDTSGSGVDLNNVGAIELGDHGRNQLEWICRTCRHGW